MSWGGASGKQIAGCLGLGWVCAAVATAYNRGYFDRYLEERTMQESESSLAVINQSQKAKVTKVPMTAPAAAAAAASQDVAAAMLSEQSTPTTAAAVAAVAAAEAGTSAVVVVDGGNSSSSASDKWVETARQVGHRIKCGLQDGLLWVQENPKTAILLATLLYALQHEYRRKTAHEHFEDRERAKRRKEEDEKRRQGGAGAEASAASASGGAPAGAATIGGAMGRSKTFAGFNDGNSAGAAIDAAATRTGNAAAAPSAAAATAAAGTANENFPTSTWDSRARASTADPEFEALVASLSSSALEEFTCSLLNLNFTDADEKKWLPYFTQSVKDQILSVAPQAGFKAVLRPGSGNLRFQDSQGTYHKQHGDILFAVDILQRELVARRKDLKKKQNPDATMSQ